MCQSFFAAVYKETKMTNLTASTISNVNTIQAAFTVLSTLGMYDFRFPADTTTANLLSEYDVVIVGGGTSGSVVANRLSENPDWSVLLLEAGSPPSLEHMLPGMFNLLPNGGSDWNQTSTDNGLSLQNLVGKFAEMTAGKVLGGSSCIDHMIQIRGNRRDYERWQNITGDDSLAYDALLKYFKKWEGVEDEEIYNNYSDYHGNTGPVRMTKQTSPVNDIVLNAIQELGQKSLVDLNADDPLGYTQPLCNIADGERYSTAVGYLSPIINRTNLHVKYNVYVKKVLFDSTNTATGVEILDSNDQVVIIGANKEVILSAGTVHTPDILTKSGVGVKEILDDLEIPTVTNLDVGKNLVDHCGLLMVYPLNETNITTNTNYRRFPVDMTVGSSGLNNSEYPLYQTVNLIFPKSSSGLMQFCAWVFKYTDSICQKMYAANADTAVLVAALYIILPESRGQVITSSTEPRSVPTVISNHLGDDRDKDVLAQSVMDYNRIANTSYFLNINSTMVDFDLPKCSGLDRNSYDYFYCYAVEMSSPIWHFVSTCPIGTVLNTDMTVKNTTNLRVVDASAMPYTVSGKIQSPLLALTEKACDIIKADHAS